MKKLEVLTNYSSSLGAWQKGQEIEVEEWLYAALLRDAPGCFGEPGKKKKALDGPPEDKMVKSAPKKK